MSVCRKIKKTFDKLRNIVERDSRDASYCDDIFPAPTEMLKQLTNEEEEEIVLVRQTRADVTPNPDNNYSKFHGYIMKDRVKDATATCQSKFIDILLNLKTALTVQMELLLENPVFLEWF